MRFDLLALDGVHTERPDGMLRFRRVAAPTNAEPTCLTRTLAHHIGRFLEPRGLLERDAESSHPDGPPRKFACNAAATIIAISS